MLTRSLGAWLRECCRLGFTEPAAVTILVLYCGRAEPGAPGVRAMLHIESWVISRLPCGQRRLFVRSGRLCRGAAGG